MPVPPVVNVDVDCGAVEGRDIGGECGCNEGKAE